MTPIADMVEQMLAEGVAASAIVLAIRTVELASVTRDVTCDAHSDTPGAIRTRRWREKRNQNVMLAEANDAAQQPVSERHTIPSHVTQRCDLTSLSLKEASNKGSEERKVVARARGTRLADDWQPSEKTEKFVRELGLDPAALRDEFVDFWSAVPGSRGLKLDWDKTFKNRARDVAGRKRGTHATPAPNRFRGALDRLRESIAEDERSQESGPPPPRLLSHG